MKKIQSKWLVWLFFGCAFMISFFHRYAIGVLSERLMEELTLTTGSLSLLSSLYFYTYGLMQLPSGLLVDAHGPRRVIVVGLSTVAVGAFLFIGFGSATVFTAIFVIQANWFRPNEFATISGFTSLIGNLGGLAATTPLVWMAATIGWRSTSLLSGIWTLLLAGLIFLFIQDKPDSPDNHPRRGGQETKTAETMPPAKTGLLKGMKVVLSASSTWVNIVILFTIFGSYMSFTGLWGSTYLIQVHGMPLSQAANLIMTFLVGTMVGAPLIGLLSDRLGNRKNVLQMSIGLLTLFWGLLLFVLPGISTWWIMAPLLFLMGCMSISGLLCFANTKEHHPPERVGIAVGMVNIAPFFGTALINTAVARMLGEAAAPVHYLRGGRVYFAACLLALLASFFLTEAHASRQGRQPGGEPVEK